MSGVGMPAARSVRLALGFASLLIALPAAAQPRDATIVPERQSALERRRGYLIAGSAVLSGQLALIVGLLVERRRRRRAEASALGSEAQYRSVVDSQSELICRFLPDTTLTFVNDAYCRFAGRPREHLLGTKFLELIPESARNEVLARIAILGSGTESHEHRVKLPDGTLGWHHWTNHAIVDRRGHVVEVQGIGRDVTERKRAEEAAGRFEARNTAIMRAIPDLLFVLLRDGTYVDYQARDPALLFAPPEDFIGKTVRDVLPEATADLLMEAIETACAGRDPVVVEYELQLDEARCFEARLVYAEEDCVLAIVRDVTESKRADALNRDLAGRLIASQELERRRIARELHDGICQDVAAIGVDLSHVRRTAGAGLSGELEAMLQAVERRTAGVAEALRLLSHGLHPSVLQHIGLVPALHAHCAEVERQHNILVRFDVPEDVEPVSRAVALSLFRIAQEALRNAVLHGRARHALVALSRTDSNLTMVVSDDGAGFDLADARREGLGLMSIEERARLANGRVVIRTRPGRGTEIRVMIPAADVDATDAGLPLQRRRSGAAARRK